MGTNVDYIGSTISDSLTPIDINRGFFRTRIFRVSELIAMLKSKKLQFTVGHPLKNWSRSHKCLFIENLLIGLPPDSIIIDGSDSPWHIVDGAEAISTINEYIQGKFQLDSVNFYSSPYVSATFNELSLMMQGRLLNLQITATILTSDATPLHRLGVYSSALVKIGKENYLWECAEVIYKRSIQKLKELTTIIKTDNPHLLLRIINAIIFSNCFISGSFKEFPDISEIRFDMFECLLLGAIDSIYQNVRTLFETNRSSIEDIVRFSEENMKIIPRNQEKKRIIFIICITLLSLNHTGYRKDYFISRFNEAWSIHTRISNGNLNQDYAKKASVIYNYLSK